MKKSSDNKRVTKTPSRRSGAVKKKPPTSSKKKLTKRSSKQSPLPGKSEDSASSSDNSDTPHPDSDVLIEAEELLFPGGIETLLPCKSRKELPQLLERRGPKCKLVEIVLRAPHIYQRLIGLIRTGVSFNVAAECSGIEESTFFSWGWKGAKDVGIQRDTYFSRFYRDVRRAAASRTAECEREVGSASPLKYITHGPGRVFGNPWAKDKSKQQSLNGNANGSSSNGNGQMPSYPGGPNSQGALPSPDEVIDATFTLRPDLEGFEEEGYGEEGQEAVTSIPRTHGTDASKQTVLQLTSEQEYEALEVLESIGQLTLSPSLKEAYRQQSGVQGTGSEETE
jgi:hypothetical protein